MTKKRLAVIDGKSVFYRGYYAMPGLSTKDGTPTGGVFGFASLAIELIKKLEPDFVVVAWDKKGTNIRRRREIYPEYKAGRKKAPQDFYDQIPVLYQLLEAFGWPLYELDDYEADDLLGTFAVQAGKKGYETCLLTSDLDALQVIDENTSVYALKNGLANIEKFDVEGFSKKYGIRLDQFLDYKALKGDSSDNLPGVPGVGDKTATQLLNEYQTLDGIYEHIDEIKPAVQKKLIAGKDSAYITKAVGKIWTDAPVELDWDRASIENCDLSKVKDILHKLEFNSLVKRLPDHMQITEDSTIYTEVQHEVELREVDWNLKLVDDIQAVVLSEKQILVGLTGERASRINIVDFSDEIIQKLSQSQIFVYDGKDFLHQTSRLGLEFKEWNGWDVRQAAFLIDPLRRDRSLSALLGEEINSDIEELQALMKVGLWQKEALENLPEVKNIALNYDFPLVYHLFKMEQRGVRLDKRMLSEMSQKLSDEIADIEQKIYTFSETEFNVASPMQLSEVLFEKLNLPTTGIKKNRNGFSTDQKTLDKLRGVHPIIDLIHQFREISKLKNTYIDALPDLADEDDRLHTTFNQDGAATGRLSSINPNLQNIPIRSERGRLIRQAFIPSEGKVFVSADYSQFELRLAAVLAGDKKLIQDFNDEIDIHTKTASEVYGIPLEEVTKDQRRDAKVINFGVLYGMSPHGLAAATGMGFYQAKEFIEQYFELRRPIREYINQTLKQARELGYVQTFYGRRRQTPDVNSSNFMVRSSAERAAANMPIQGTEADLMKRAMIRVDEELGDVSEQILQIHDSILLECSPEDSEKVASKLQKIMENIAPELDIKLKVDVGIGNNWGEL